MLTLLQILTENNELCKQATHLVYSIRRRYVTNVNATQSLFCSLICPAVLSRGPVGVWSSVADDIKGPPVGSRWANNHVRCSVYGRSQFIALAAGQKLADSSTVTFNDMGTCYSCSPMWSTWAFLLRYKKEPRTFAWIFLWISVVFHPPDALIWFGHESCKCVNRWSRRSIRANQSRLDGSLDTCRRRAHIHLKVLLSYSLF